MPHDRNHGRTRQVEPIRDGETYTKERLRTHHGIGTRTWNRLIKAGMPVDYVGNRVFQRGEVIREWIARLAEDKRNAAAKPVPASRSIRRSTAKRAQAQDLALAPVTEGVTED